ncbi:hypothetical protein HII36_52665 [Nonomuraea sp. NN258]|uniref:hypothetical protein n=1 Tax=Nonomuraea antri TaxID=2730852 RepID=UPI001567DEEF|nr:hypothetical protein [Nonomuraea antri]NRQ40416.1 hypothetical protein [Nonomuraea antri]
MGGRLDDGLSGGGRAPVRHPPGCGLVPSRSPGDHRSQNPLPTTAKLSPLTLDADELAAVEQDPQVSAIVAAPTRDKLRLITELAARIAVSTTNLHEHELVDRAFRIITSDHDHHPDKAEVCNQLFAWMDTLLRQAYTAFESSGMGDKAGPIPGHETVHGRLLLQRACVETLKKALADDDPAYVAYTTARQAGATQPDRANGDEGRVRALLLAAHHVYDQG